MSKFGKSGAWKGWITLCADVCWETYGGLWARRDSSAERAWYVIEHTDMVEACGSDADGHDRYVSEIRYVDLDAIPASELESACECCGLDLGDVSPENRDVALVEVCARYGAYAPMGTHTDPSYPERARAAARRDVESLLADADATEERLDRPVNALGSTAREYAAGDFQSAMARGVHAGDPSARVMAKMHGIPQEAIDDARPADFLPYLMGYMAGINGGDPETDPDLAPEYTQGYERGVRVRKGEAPAPSWIQHGGAPKAGEAS